ncbi:MAG: 2-C-methyl-D-erythritol 4-phosphate cytidylyltransferase, partial [Acidimicrobiales bacterium]|nr:2-C-methyl-D-erythritol 4-phosphate cytidylyltransferase [Acidimicrobiales bacterium]
MSVWTVVVAAGRAERFGGDKQMADLGGRPVVAHSVSAAAKASDGVVVVVAADKRAEALILLDGLDCVAVVVDGGATRSASVRSGLAAVPADVEIVMVHDGARPLASTALF